MILRLHEATGILNISGDTIGRQKYFELSTLPLKIPEFIPRFGI